MKKFMVAFIALVFAVSFIPTPTQAWVPKDKIPPGQQESLLYGTERVNSHTTRTLVDSYGLNKRYETKISTIPTTLDDNVTLIDTSWYLLSDSSGQSWYENGDNLFTARVVDGRVSIQDEDGHLVIWNSTITIDGVEFEGGTPGIVNDPVDSNYKSNTLRWKYGDITTGWLFKERGAVIRYLRNTEGFIQELWQVPIKPGGDITINLNKIDKEKIKGNITWLRVYDNKHHRIQFEVRGNNYVIPLSSFPNDNSLYPITIDPSANFGDYSPKTISLEGSSYGTVHDTASGDSSYSGIWIYYYGNAGYEEYEICRGFLYFDTSSIPVGSTVLSAELTFKYGYWNNESQPVVIRTGMPTYPHYPLVLADYNYTHYSGNGGSLNCPLGSVVWEEGYITLNETGKSWINAGGDTKFALIFEKDINSVVPDADNWFTCSYTELTVDYIVPAVTPTVVTDDADGFGETQVTLHGTLSDDGNEDCSVRFEYGLTDSYGSYTSLQIGKQTDDTFASDLYGLSRGQTYHFRAVAVNSAGTDKGDDKTFSTYPAKPVLFAANAGDEENNLTWTKGDGADKTMVRWSTVSYPTAVDEGTQAYFDTASEYDHTSLASGTPYYYSAWSWANSVYSTTYVTDTATPFTQGVPDVTTNEATDVAATTTTVNGYLDALNGYDSVDCSFQYYTGAGTWTDNESTPAALTETGSFYADLDTLSTDTLYHFRAKGENVGGIAYGDSSDFTTGAGSAPSMKTNSATGVQLTTVVLNGEVVDDGSTSVTVWFEWGLTTDYGDITDTYTGLGDGDTFFYNLDGLEPATTYHFRVFGENAVGIGYGEDENFQTASPDLPVVTTGSNTVGAVEATLFGNLTDDGGVTCDVGFQYGIDTGYDSSTGWITDKSSSYDFSQVISGLVIGETYHYRAQAKNGAGTAYGADATFTTRFVPPSAFSARSVSTTTVKLSWTESGDMTHIRYKQGSFPIDREDGLPCYFGSDEQATVSSLSDGRTYYFRAWSWRTGDVWAEGYSDAVATTPSSGALPEELDPDSMLLIPSAPTGWLQEPSGEGLSNLPFYSQVNALADAYEMPHGSLWLILSIVLTIAFGLIVFFKGAGMLVSIIAAVGSMVFFGIIGTVPMFMIAIYLCLGGGIMFIAKRI